MVECLPDLKQVLRELDQQPVAEHLVDSTAIVVGEALHDVEDPTS
jgi:hypothetical protein